jgi:TM2 domain-containing membrane protein YozV
MDNTKPHPGTAAVFSFVFNGLGQIYNGQIKKGLMLVTLSTISMFILIFGAVLIGYSIVGRLTLPSSMLAGFILFAVGAICAGIVGIYSIFDAYRVAQKLNL